jgi:uncharacterized RDD family membrane protein YckC
VVIKNKGAIMNYAGFWKRFMAMMLDFAILILPMFALNVAIPYAGSVILAVLYYPIFESSPLQATPGKYWMGLKVLSENGQTLTFPRALARFFLKYVSSVLLMMGYLIQLFTAKRQTLHDLISNAVVVEHVYTQTPDWIQTWIRQMRTVLKVNEPGTLDTWAAQNTSSEAASTAAHSSAEAVQSIEKLYELFKSGVLTEEEFQNKKAELLRQV